MNASFIGGIIAVVVILLIIAVIKTYNHMVVLRNRVDNQGAQIEVQLKRRADLIPNLLETTKGYAHYEQETLSKITELRSRVLNASSAAESFEAGNALGREISHILAVGEQYPELKANQNFLQLQSELKETENKIVMARQFYNDTVITRKLYEYTNKADDNGKQFSWTELRESYSATVDAELKTINDAVVAFNKKNS